jgi:uracil-DNA glycosylase family 4
MVHQDTIVVTSVLTGLGMENLLQDIRQCTLCAQFLPNAPKPIISVSKTSKILIIGQAPGQKVQDSGRPWADASGKELRRWLGVSDEQFYDTNIFGIMPMGMCFPGTGNSGDLPPRPECAPKWHNLVLSQLDKVELILLIGQYAQKYYLKEANRATLTETVQNYKAYLPKYLPLPHPSPRNRIWMKKNDWFETDIVPFLQKRVETML